MCGRYAFNCDPREVQSLFGLVELPEPVVPRYNIAPTQRVPAVAATANGLTRRLTTAAWGLLPSWAPNEQTTRPINARAETVHASGMFRQPFARQRCLLPATGFYEWRSEGKKKHPYFIRLKSQRPFALAGLWERWEGGEKPLFTCCSLTTTPNEVVRPIHDRMPVIVPAAHFTEWLAVGTPVARLRELLVSYPADEMEAFPVSSYVSRAGNEGVKCIEPLTVAALA